MGGRIMKRIGDYIREVNVRNRDLGVGLLLGVSITKRFIPSIANTIGTDMTTYKLINKGQFAYGSVTSRNGEKVSIALLADHDTAIVSQAYTVFEITDTEVLLPEYLMMWFLRPEFDRYARFKSHGSARETFDWSELCSVELPIPSLERQQSIVSEYNVLKDRIKLNEQLCSRLEQSAQAIYLKWFVDDIDPENLPDGWRMGTIGEFCNISSSKRIYESEYVDYGVPFYRGKEITLKKNGGEITNMIYISRDRYNGLVSKYGQPKYGDILLTAVGTIGNSYMVQDEEFYFKDGNIIWFSEFITLNYNYYLYDYMQSETFYNMITEITIGSTQSAITIATLSQQPLIIPTNIEEYLRISMSIHKNILTINNENTLLKQLRNILLSKLATN